MLEYSLDAVLSALADPTRRAMVERLSHGPLSVSALSSPFSVTLAAIGQHIRVLEECGLVSSKKVGRVRTVALQPSALAAADAWFAAHRHRWHERLEALDAIVHEDDDSQ